MTTSAPISLHRTASAILTGLFGGHELWPTQCHRVFYFGFHVGALGFIQIEFSWEMFCSSCHLGSKNMYLKLLRIFGPEVLCNFPPIDRLKIEFSWAMFPFRPYFFHSAPPPRALHPEIKKCDMEREI